MLGVERLVVGLCSMARHGSDISQKHDIEYCQYLNNPHIGLYWQNLPNILPYNSIRSVWRAPYTLFSNTLLCSPVSYQPPELVRGHTHMGASKITVKIIRTHYYTAGENTTQNIICQRWRTTRASQERPASRSGRRGASHGSRGSAKSKVRATSGAGARAGSSLPWLVLSSRALPAALTPPLPPHPPSHPPPPTLPCRAMRVVQYARGPVCGAFIAR